MAKKEPLSEKASAAAEANPKPIENPEVAPIGSLEQLLADLHNILEVMRTDMMPTALTLAERRRLQGSGVRRYGFIDNASDVAEANPEFAPAFFTSAQLKNKIREIEVVRNISLTLQQMLRISDDLLLVLGDEAFQMALSYYNTVREAARRRQPGAMEIYRQMEPFFRRPRRPSDEPTEAEVLRDVKAGIHGTKDVDIRIENEKPEMVGGKHIVIDETHKPEGHWKATEEGEIE